MCQAKNLIFILFDELQADLKIFVGLDVTRLELQSDLEMFKGFLQLPLADKGRPQIAVDLGIVWFEAQCLPEMNDGLFQLVTSRQGHADITMGGRVAGVEIQAIPKCLIASSVLPWAARAVPRLLCALA